MPTTADHYQALSDREINHDRLGFTFCVALALHAAFILGVSFSHQPAPVASPKLEITLAQHRSPDAPDKADFLAQNNQQGSGTLEEKAMLTTQQLANFQDTAIREITEHRQASQSNPRQAENPLLASKTASQFKSSRLQADPQTEQYSEQQPDDLTIVQRKLEIASLEARLDIQRQAYANRPRVRRLTSVATRQSDDALYLHNWRSKVETIGNLHYPSKAKQLGLYGNLRMVVSILPNGEVHQVKILQSSGHKILDQAAIKIVHLAAPYDEFPLAMQRNVDVLEIIRTWRFHKDRLTSSS